MEPVQDALHSLKQLFGGRDPGATVLPDVLLCWVRRHYPTKNVGLGQSLQVRLVNDGESCREELAERAV